MSSSLPTKLIFLVDLPAHQPGDKVRFLGCVEGYDAPTGVLSLKHDYKSSKHTARVTIDHVRESLHTTATALGAWINVVGYVHSHDDDRTTVQATIVWEAGPLKVADYEQALQARYDAN